MDSRKEFERWYSEDGHWSKYVEHNGETYIHWQTEIAWGIWQEAVKACKEHWVLQDAP